MRKIAFCACLALMASPQLKAQTPAGWQIVKSPKPLAVPGTPEGKGAQCQIAVPGDWVPNTVLNKFGQTHFNSPASQEARGGTSLYEFAPGRPFSDAKDAVTRYNEPIKVFENSTKRYWYQSKASSSAFVVWEVIIAADPVCALAISFNSDSMEDTARKIALSLSRSE